MKSQKNKSSKHLALLSKSSPIQACTPTNRQSSSLIEWRFCSWGDFWLSCGSPWSNNARLKWTRVRRARQSAELKGSVSLSVFFQIDLFSYMHAKALEKRLKSKQADFELTGTNETYLGWLLEPRNTRTCLWKSRFGQQRLRECWRGQQEGQPRRVRVLTRETTSDEAGQAPTSWRK